MAPEATAGAAHTGPAEQATETELFLRPARLVTLVEMLRTGSITAAEHLGQVDAWVQRVDPHIHALLPERRRLGRLRMEARQVAERWPDPRTRPALYGVPIGVKDLFRVDGLPTRAGSQLPARLFAGPEAAVVSVLRAAGAVVLGKTAMDEFAYCEPAATRNPHQLGHTPGGSSSGSAAAVAAGLCPLALGTQTSRSVIGPAAFCGVVGFKPSYGRIPTDGSIPLAPSFDTVGLFTQDVAGMLLAAEALVPGWRAVTPQRRPVLGVPDGLFLTWTLDEGRHAFERHVQRLVQAGYVMQRVPFFAADELLEMDRQAMGLLHGEMARVHADWYPRYQARYRPRTARGVQRGQAVSEHDLAAFRAGRFTFRARITALMQTARVDLWITPASAGPAPAGLELTGWGGMTTAWSYAGLPCVTVPAGRASTGLPLGVQCVGGFGQDEALLSWAEDVASVLSDPGAHVPAPRAGILPMRLNSSL